jgi:hypothetical protein
VPRPDTRRTEPVLTAAPRPAHRPQAAAAAVARTLPRHDSQTIETPPDTVSKIDVAPATLRFLDEAPTIVDPGSRRFDPEDTVSRVTSEWLEVDPDPTN